MKMHPQLPYPAATNPMPITTWLTATYRLNSPECIIYIGVGEAYGELIDWLKQTSPKRVLLVEADPQKYENICKRQTHPEYQNHIPAEWQVINAVVTPNGEETTYYRTNVPSEDGIIAPNNLKAYWPNIAENTTQDNLLKQLPKAMSIVELIKQGSESIDADTQKIWLIVDTLASQLILAHHLPALINIELIVAKLGLLDTSEYDASEVGTLNHISQILSDCDLSLAEKQTLRHSHLAYGLWFKTVDSITRQSKQRQQALFNTQVNEYVHQIEKNAQEKLDVEKTIVNLQNEQARGSQINQELNTKIISLQKEYQDLSDQHAKIVHLNEELYNEKQKHNDELAGVLNKIEELNKNFVATSYQKEIFKQDFEKLHAEHSALQTEHQQKSDDYAQLVQEHQKLTNVINQYEQRQVEFESMAADIYEYKRAQNYFIKPDYVSRTEYTHYDDQAQEDKWQLEVYLHALGLMKKYALNKVVDLGCGSGWKLIKYLGDYETIGLEIDENMPFLREKYPDRKWLESNFEINHQIQTDVLICSDVIEHIVDPDQLIRYIKRIAFKYLVLSTPERDLVYEAGASYLNGPPRNPAHVREWNFSEFKDYISQYFEVLDHRVTNLQQSTQMIICINYL